MANPLARALETAWYRDVSIPALLLLPFSQLFRLLVWLRRLGYRHKLWASHRLPVPVIVVGNITVGGAGKTPLVLWLVERLTAAGYRPGVVSRGYGGRVSATLAVTPTTHPELCGDEPALIAWRTHCPVWVGADRVMTARHLLAANPDCNVVISDDGLQHYGLQRTVELAVVDGERGLGNGLLLPAGPLREPAERLDEVDAVIQNGLRRGLPLRRNPPFAMELAPMRLYQVCQPEQELPLTALRGKRLHAIAGIGNPQRFFALLRDLALDPVCHAFPDHHRYTPADLQFADADLILMTEKDAVKCCRLGQDPRWLALAVDAIPEDGLAELILQRLTIAATPKEQ